jgi:hypothetical protein
MTRVLEMPTILYVVDCDFCGQVNPDNPLASRSEVEDLEVEHRRRHCRNCYMLDSHEPWCDRGDR